MTKEYSILIKSKGILFRFVLLYIFNISLNNSLISQPFIWKNVAIGAGGFVSAIIPSQTQPGLMYARTDVGGAYRWNALTEEWIPLTDWVSDSEVGFLGVEGLALDPQDASKLYMLVGISYFSFGRTAILRSSDYGNTFDLVEVTSQFRAHGNGMGRQAGEKLMVDPNNSNTLYCGTRWNGLFRSTNAGATWTNLSSFPVTTTPNENGISFVVIDKNSGTPGNNSQKIFVGVSRSGSNNFFVSTNGGASFAAVTGAPTTYMPHRAVLASDGNMYITYGNGAGPHGHWAVPEPMDAGQVWKYNTNTGVWTNVTPAGFTRAFAGISVDPNNPNRLLLSTINTYMLQYTTGGSNVWGDRFFITTNGGTTWRDLVGASGIVMNPNGNSWINGHSIHWAGCIEFNPFNTNQAWITSGNGVFSCDNVNATQTTWKFNVKGLEETVPLDIVSIPGGPVVSTIGDYDGFVHTDLTQYPPIHSPGMGTTTGLAYAGSNVNKLVRVGNSMYYSTNQGSSWTQCAMNGTKGKVALSANGNTFLHCPDGSNITYRSTNNGASWANCNGLNFQNVYPIADPVNSNKFYAYNPGTGVMMVSTDGGVNFSNGGSPGNNGSKIVRTVPNREGHLWVPLYNGGLRRSVNSGTTFTNIPSVTYCAAVGIGKSAPSATYETIYIWGTVGGVRGAFRSTDEGATWLRINSDDQEFGGPGNGQFIIGDMNIYGRVIMSTAGRGIVYVDTGNPLPVDWLSFHVTKQDNMVLLQWQTASETQNDYFEIQRSIDGINFLSIAKVSGNGTTQYQSTYQYKDNLLSTGIFYYRIRQVDNDGSYSYSPVKQIYLSGSLTAIAYPNPFKNNLNVAKQGGIIKEIEIIDLSGKVLLKVVDSFENINTSGLSSGLYLIKITTDTSSEVVPILKE